MGKTTTKSKEKLRHKKRKSFASKASLFFRGFTIIEVILVLAIAGLIFLMIFIGLPMLQRAQRNTQREDDLSRFLSAVTEFQSNNRGRTPFQNATPTSGTQFINRYIDSTCQTAAAGAGISNMFLFGNIIINNPASNACTGNQFRDPDGTIYRFNYIGTFNATAGASANAATLVDNSAVWNASAMHTIHVVSSAVCGTSEGVVVRGAGPNYVAMFMQLEGGAFVCVTNGTRGGNGNETPTATIEITAGVD